METFEVPTDMVTQMIVQVGFFPTQPLGRLWGH